jgi:hypothetical protein
VLFRCVGVAGSTQEEDRVCEDILQRNVVLITPFGSSEIPPPYIRLRRVRQSPQNQVLVITLQNFPGHHYPANLGVITHTPLISLRSSLILLISTKEGP